MNNIAIIPARGGSKRIPRKNIKDFLGKPIIAYSIETAVKSGLFDEIMVSTDDDEIAKVAIKYGAKVPFMRSAKNSDDFATTADVLEEVLNFYKNKNKQFDAFCCIYPTAPLIQIQHLKQGLSQLIENNMTSVFPLVPFSYPVWRGVELDETNKVKMVWPEFQNSRSQDLKTVYHDAGQWYWCTPQNNKLKLFSDNTGAIILSEQEVQDIDTLTDWEIAEIKYKTFFLKSQN